MQIGGRTWSRIHSMTRRKLQMKITLVAFIVPAQSKTASEFR
jgi:hypothetical protein